MEPPKDRSPIPVTCDIVDPKVDKWDQLGKEIYKNELQVFGEESSETEEDLRRWFDDERCVVAVMKDPNGQLIGHSFATPISEPDVPEHHQKLDDKETAYIMTTAIVPEYQGRKLVGALIGTLETGLKAKGYKYIERDTAVPNGYADSIERHYGERILDKKDRIHPVHGPQRSFRIRL